jgi:aspartyl protease family protein
MRAVADDKKVEGAPSRGALTPSGEHEYSGGKTLRFALIAAGMCIASGLLTTTLMTYVARGVVATNAAPVRATPAAAPLAPVALPRPKPPSNQLVYHADASGHFYIDAAVNGAVIRFLVDTGATMVVLTPDDARAAGIYAGGLTYSQTMSTANGQAQAAPTTLRDVRLEQLTVDNVDAVVMQQPMAVSLLGMSFLKRLNGYAIRDGALTIDW